MSNPFDEVRIAVAEAELQLRAVDRATTDMVRLLVGRLRRCDSGYLLACLKKELREFDGVTKTWRGR